MPVVRLGRPARLFGALSLAALVVAPTPLDEGAPAEPARAGPRSEGADAPAGPRAAEVRPIIEGTWRLEEWHVDGQVVKPAEADGRWSVHDGVVFFMVRRRSGDRVDSSHAYGEYVLDDAGWRYRYVSFTSVRESGGQATVSQPQPWDGMRAYRFRREPGRLVLDNENGRRLQIFEGDRTTKSTNQQINKSTNSS